MSLEFRATESFMLENNIHINARNNFPHIAEFPFKNLLIFAELDRNSAEDLIITLLIGVI